MKHKFLKVEQAYDGAQLMSLRNYLEHGLLGDSVVAWIGACNVTFDHMVDGEDLLAKAQICGDRMLHFVIETFDTTLIAAVALQRLFAGIVRDEIAHLSAKSIARELHRAGDDLFYREHKLSISIATQSPLSSLIHFAVNVTNQGTPVKTLALEDDLAVNPTALAERVLDKFSAEFEDIRLATRKVRWVK